MGLVGWIVSIAALLGGLALWQDRPFAGALLVAGWLLAVAFLGFPPIWRDRPLGISPAQRIALCLALLLAMPLILLRA